MADIERAIAEGNKVLAQLRRVCPAPGELPPPVPSKNRIRQSSKPLSNKLETELGVWLKLTYPECPIWEQAITFRLGNGVRYSPDWVIWKDPNLCCYEVKGPKAWDDAIVKLKVAASLYSRFGWFLCYKVNGVFQVEAVHP